MYSLPTSSTLAALTIASAASIDPISPRVSTMPSASDAMCGTHSNRIAEYHSTLMGRYCVWISALLIAATSACGRTEDNEPPIVTPSVSVGRSDAAVGTPLEMSYRFVVANNAPAFYDNYWV